MMKLSGVASLLMATALHLAISPPAVMAREAPAAEKAAAQSALQRQSQMNVIFVLVDDLRFDSMGFLNPGLRTPNVDYLAKNGVYFRNAVVTSSLCSPSRATILTGQSPRNHHVIDNNNPSEEGLVFFSQYLQQAGYETAFVGKWHMGAATDAPRPGWGRWVSFSGQGSYLPTNESGRQSMLNVDGQRVPQKGYITDELTDYGMDWLERRRDKSKPFFLYLSHKAVHSEVTPADKYKNQYSDLTIAPPASMSNTPENNRGKPLWVRNQRNSWHGAEFPYHTDESPQDLQRGVYRALSSVDDSLGRVLEYLKRNNLEKNTMVVFTSDNGFLYGDHGLIDKRNAYEPSVRVPLLVYAPGLLPKGVTNQAVVRNLDFAPTFLDLAKVAKPQQMEGESWIPLATGKMKAGEWNKRDFIYEYYWEWTFPMTPTTFAIERDRVKYIQYHGIWDTEELYDLNKDPEEMSNLVDDPAYTKTKIALRQSLYRALANNEGAHVVPFTGRHSSGAHNRKLGGSRAGDFPEEWYTEPNRPDRMRNLYPESPEKLIEQTGQTQQRSAK